MNIGATPRQLLQVNAGGTTAEWASNIDIPGTLDVVGAVVLDSTLNVAGAMTFDDSVTITGTLDVNGLLTCDASATIDTAGTALNLATDNSGDDVNLGVGTTLRDIGIGDSAAAHTITIGSVTGACSLDLLCGSGNFTLVPTAAGTITLGATDTTGTMTFGLSTAAGGQTINVGNGVNAGAQIVNIASGASAADSTVNVFGGIATAGTQTLNLATGASTTLVNIGNATSATAVVITSGTGSIALASTGAGDITINSDDTLLLDADGVLELNSSAGVIGIGSDDDDFGLNLGTLGERTITLGNTAGVTDVVFNSGTGGFAFNPTGAGDITFTVSAGGMAIVGAGNAIGVGDDAANNTVTVGSTNGTAATIIQSGTGDLVLTSTDDLTVDSAGLLELNSSAGVIGIGSDADAFDINVGTGAAQRIITIGNVTSATQVVINAGTAGIALASTGAGDITINSDDTLLLDSDGVLELNSSAGAISIANDAVSLTVNVATGAADMTTVVGSTNTTSTTTVQSGTGGVVISGAGAVSMVPATNSAAAASLTLNARVGVATFTGLTTGAGSNVDLTITNSAVTQGQGIFCTVSNIGSNDADITLEGCITETGGTLLLRCQNNGAAALNGDIIATFWLIN